VFELTVRSTLANLLPAVALNETNDVADLHARPILVDCENDGLVRQRTHQARLLESGGSALVLPELNWITQ
jgi:hypothetical protein